MISNLTKLFFIFTIHHHQNVFLLSTSFTLNPIVTSSFVTRRRTVNTNTKAKNEFVFSVHQSSDTYFTTTKLSAKRSGAISRKNKSKSGKGGFGNTSDDIVTNETEYETIEPINRNENDNINNNNSNKITLKSLLGDGTKIYSKPALYDLAFGYRSFEDEVDFLLKVHNQFSSSSPGTDQKLKILELAAGPSRHSITAIKQFYNNVSSCVAVDTNGDMRSYALEIAKEELESVEDFSSSFQYMLGDMRYIGSQNMESANSNESSTHPLFSLLEQKSTFDSAWLLLGSMQHLTTNNDVISCLTSTCNLLRTGGTLILELPHPRETFTMVECTKNGWEVPLEDENGNNYGELKIIWGDENDVFDPIRQVRDFTIEMNLVVDESKIEQSDSKLDQNVKEIVPLRLFTLQEIDALGRIAGFELVATYGALDEEVDVNSEDEAFRLVCVLRKS